MVCLFIGQEKSEDYTHWNLLDTHWNLLDTAVY